MHKARICNQLRRENAVAVAVLRRHEAVGRKEDRARDIGELLLLILPGGSEVALEVRVCLQLRIRVGGQHLAVGVDIDALPFCLLQKLLQIIQVVAVMTMNGPFSIVSGTVVGTGVP
jgi:hypothetical protein